MSDEAGVSPAIAIEMPLPDAEIIEGDTFDVEVTVSDDVVVDTVEIKIGEQSLGVAQFPGAFASFNDLVMPLGVGPLDITVIATDLGGNDATDTVQVSVIPDPLTTVIGIIVDENQDPVEGATVTTINDLSSVTEMDGTFSIPGVPTIEGGVVVTATVVIDDIELNGRSEASTPVQSGVTDVGTITVTEKPDTILIFGDRFERNNLETNLTNLGFEVLDNISTLPEDLTIYGTIWHVSAFAVLSSAERDRLTAFVESGRGLHLTGERPCCDNLNDSLELLMNDLVIAGGINVGRMGDINGPYPFNPDALGNITSSPNGLTSWIPSASGGISSIDGDNVLVTGAGGVPVGGVWDCGDFVGNAGRVTLFMDVNWFANDVGREATIENIHTFLLAATRCGAGGN